MIPINAFLLANQVRIAANPCISPDFCLDWPGLQQALAVSRGQARGLLADGIDLGEQVAFPATWINLLSFKNRLQQHAGGSTVFPSARGGLAHTSLGVGPASRRCIGRR